MTNVKLNQVTLYNPGVSNLKHKDVWHVSRTWWVNDPTKPRFDSYKNIVSVISDARRKSNAIVLNQRCELFNIWISDFNVFGKIWGSLKMYLKFLADQILSFQDF